MRPENSGRRAILSREQQLIREILAPLCVDADGAFGLRDDAAELHPSPGRTLVVTADALVAGVHFFEDDPPDLIARKALRVNLSDLAAKGADPWAYFVTLALGTAQDEAWLRDFAGGLGQDQEAFGCMLHGGDTVRTPGALTISVTAIGRLSGRSMVRREGAQPGDLVYVSGTIGDAVLGLDLRAAGDDAPRWAAALDRSGHRELAERYLLPRPRGGLAHALRSHASAAIDVSDGVAGDLALLCTASGTAVDIRVSALPLSAPAKAALQADTALWQRVLSGGDDYEILCAVAPDAAADFEAAARAGGVPVTCIGRMTAGAGAVRFIGANGVPIVLPSLSYSHL